MAKNLLIEDLAAPLRKLATTLPIRPRQINRQGLPAGLAVSDYSPDLAAVLSRFKRTGSMRLLDHLCLSLAEEIRKNYQNRDWLLIAVPSTAAATRVRGFIPAELIAKRLASLLPGSRIIRGNLWHSKLIRDQAALGIESRQKNLEWSIRASPSLRKYLARDIALVDDLITTGASMRECCRALREMGIEVTAVFALGETLRKTVH